ncbi:RTA1 like protein [Aspergillus alliaceus]|uniref:RTA1 like protein n=1 Tax=Petromyces alliaceus TaxID=209559 RepID=A0A5N7BT48_PETAA|nr:RTA1 like protein [Aspergillus alliaceus]
MVGSENGGWIAYHYYPSKAAGVLFAALFFIVSILHTCHLLRTKTWFFIPLSVGYIGRVLSANESPDWTIGPYIMQSTLLLVARALYAASIYMGLGRIIHLMKGQKLAIIRVTWITKIFITGDILSFLMQALGEPCAGVIVQSSKSTGGNINLGGLFVQKHMFTLHFSSILILIRSSFPVAEYIQGSEGFLLRNEFFIYVYDGLLMFLVTVVFLIIHSSTKENSIVSCVR